MNLMKLKPGSDEIEGHPLFEETFPIDRKSFLFITACEQRKPADVFKVFFEEIGDFAYCPLKYAGTFLNYPVIDIPSEGIAFLIGSPKEKRLCLSGFADREK